MKKNYWSLIVASVTVILEKMISSIDIPDATWNPFLMKEISDLLFATINEVR